MEQENSATFKPTPDYIKNKKIAVQLAKRYIDDYKKMQSEPGYTDQVRMDPADFNPKKDLKGKAKETEAFESWVDETVNEYATAPRDEEDRKEKLKALQDLQANPKLNDPESVEAIQKRKKELMQNEAESDYLYLNGKEIDQGSIVYDMQDYSDGIFELQSAKYADGTELDEKELEELESTQELIDWVMIDHVSEDAVPEGNQFAQAVQKAKAAGMKAGDKFKVGDDEYTLKDAIEMAGLQPEEFFSEEEMEVPAEAQAEAEKINTELDRIKTLANIA
jgi:hypothetical protein